MTLSVLYSLLAFFKYIFQNSNTPIISRPQVLISAEGSFMQNFLYHYVYKIYVYISLFGGWGVNPGSPLGCPLRWRPIFVGLQYGTSGA
jgi:hypothetical protein